MPSSARWRFERATRLVSSETYSVAGVPATWGRCRSPKRRGDTEEEGNRVRLSSGRASSWRRSLEEAPVRPPCRSQHQRTAGSVSGGGPAASAAPRRCGVGGRRPSTSAFALPTSPFLQLRDHHTRRFIRYRPGLPGTHLDLAAVPAEDGGLALGQEVVPSLGRHLGAKDLGLALQELGGDGGRDSRLIRQCGRPDHEVKGRRRQWRAA
jgi:hypothetical protein